MGKSFKKKIKTKKINQIKEFIKSKLNKIPKAIEYK